MISLAQQFTPRLSTAFISAAKLHLFCIYLPQYVEQRQKTTALSRHLTCHMTATQRWRGHMLCCQILYTHNRSHLDTHACTQNMHTRIAALIPPLVDFCLGKILFTGFLFSEKSQKRNLTGISYSHLPFSPFLPAPFYFLCPNLESSEGWLSCIWIAQCLTTGLQILIVALEIA